MSELGLRLKNAREEKGYSLDELQVKTKIQTRYLSAIEEGDYSRLPGDFYARAFVKSYADAVGLDSEMLFEEHRNELPQVKQEAVEIPSRLSRSKPKTVKKKSKFSSILPTIIVALFIIVIIVFIWVTGQDGESDSSGISRENLQSEPAIDNSSTIEDDPNENEEENEEISDENNNGTNEGNNEGDSEGNNEEDLEEAEPEPRMEYVETDGTTSYFTLTNTDHFDVVLNFTGPSWIRILDESESSLHEGTYQSGDEVTFDFSDESHITFHFGSSRTAELNINEELIEFPIDSSVQYIIVDFEE